MAVFLINSIAVNHRRCRLDQNLEELWGQRSSFDCTRSKLVGLSTCNRINKKHTTPTRLMRDHVTPFQSSSAEPIEIQRYYAAPTPQSPQKKSGRWRALTHPPAHAVGYCTLELLFDLRTNP
jgi:hypothetical protein